MKSVDLRAVLADWSDRNTPPMDEGYVNDDAVAGSILAALAAADEPLVAEVEVVGEDWAGLAVWPVRIVAMTEDVLRERLRECFDKYVHQDEWVDIIVRALFGEATDD